MCLLLSRPSFRIWVYLCSYLGTNLLFPFFFLFLFDKNERSTNCFQTISRVREFSCKLRVSKVLLVFQDKKNKQTIHRKKYPWKILYWGNKWISDWNFQVHISKPLSHLTITARVKLISYSSRALTTKNKNHLFDIVTYFLFLSTHWFQDFLAEVTSVGLQTQYEAVCENLGLIAYLVQVFVIIIIHITVIIIITAQCRLTGGRSRLDRQARI